ncbi:MAG: hypothetical protein LBE99_00380 [Puniceicoccales bacterium]|jgi:hypothetical protein|nr:hypothetical protein [Puniceicoccales bacterium]
MTPQYLLKTIFVLASGLALQAYATNTQDAKNPLENMSAVISRDVFNIDEYLDNISTQKTTSSNTNSKANPNDLKKTSPDAIWEVDYNSFNEIDPW